MFTLPLPAGYLVSRCLIRRGEKTHLEWTLTAGILGGIFGILISVSLSTQARAPAPLHLLTTLAHCWAGLRIANVMAAQRLCNTKQLS